jgi:hypothetical protein
MNQFTSGVGLGIAAGGGDDVLQFGNNGLAAITNLAFFNFVGQDGSDTFNLNNQTQTGTWTYTRNLANITATSSLGPSYTLSASSTEMMRFNGGASGETFNINAVPAGSAVEANGAAGIDILRMGPSTNSVEAIQGQVSYNAGANGGNAVVFDTADTTGDTFHLDQTTLGAFPGRQPLWPRRIADLHWSHRRKRRRPRAHHPPRLRLRHRLRSAAGQRQRDHQLQRAELQSRRDR